MPKALHHIYGLRFKHIPTFSKFILENHLHEFNEKMIELALVGNWQMPSYVMEDNVHEVYLQKNREFITALSNAEEEVNAEVIRIILKKFMPFIKDDEINISSIAALRYVYKKTLLLFINRYTQDNEILVQLVEEIITLVYMLDEIGINKYTQEITDKLKRTETMYKHTEHNAKMGNWVMYLNSGYVECTNEFYNIFEIDDRPTVTADFIIQHIHPDDKEVISKKIKKIGIADKQNYTFRIITAKGNEKVLRSISKTIYDDKGKPVIVIGSEQDVTDEVNMLRRLQESEHLYKQAQHLAKVGNWGWDLQDNKIYWSDQVYETFGLNKETMSVVNFEQVTKYMHIADLEMIRKNIDTAIKNNVPYTTAYRITTPAGEVKYVVSHGFPEIDKKGKVQKIFGTIQDITAQHKTEELLFQKNQQLELSNKSLEEFAYVASHDLQEPLRKISIFGDKLSTTNESNIDENGKLYLSKMTDAANRMQTMINDLLSLSLISSQKQFDKYNLKQLLNEVVSTLEYKIEETETTVIAENLPEAVINVSQFRQLFQNLISNSIKFIKPDVPPVITIKATELKPAEIKDEKLGKASKYLKIVFSDNGIGFEEEYATKIFNIFQRLHGRSEYEGSGIGLSICKRIVENHNGIIYAKSAPGEGAQFTIIIPQ